MNEPEAPISCVLTQGRATSLVLLAALWLVVSAQTAPAPLALVSTAWPPFTDGAGQPRFALDLVEAALNRIGLSAKTSIVSAAQFTPSLLTGAFDGSAAVWKDPERERVLLFSQPYLENRLVLVGRRGSDVSAKALSDLKGKRVAIVEGYSYGDTIDAAGPAFVRSRSEEDSLTRLLNGGVDYTLMDELVVQYIVSNYPKESGTRLQIGSTSLVTRELYFAVRRSRADAASDHRALQRADHRDDRGSHVPPPPARGLDSGGHQRRWRAGIRAAERSARSVGARTRLLDFRGSEARCARPGAHQAGVLCRRQHLQRLGERARQLQRGQLPAA